MNKDLALQICRDVVKKDEVITVVPIPVATLLLDLEERVIELEKTVRLMESKERLR